MATNCWMINYIGHIVCNNCYVQNVKFPEFDNCSFVGCCTHTTEGILECNYWKAYDRLDYLNLNPFCNTDYKNISSEEAFRRRVEAFDKEEEALRKQYKEETNEWGKIHERNMLLDDSIPR